MAYNHGGFLCTFRDGVGLILWAIMAGVVL